MIENDPLERIAKKLETSEHPTLTPEQMARIESKVIDAHTAVRRSGRLYRFYSVQRALVILIVLTVPVLIGILIALSPQIHDSVPGDWLYPLKRAMEWVEITTFDLSHTDAEVHTQLAERRTDEILTLLAREETNTSLITEAINHLVKVGQGISESPEVAPAALQIGTMLESIVSHTHAIPTETRDALSASLRVLQAVAKDT